MVTRQENTRQKKVTKLSRGAALLLKLQENYDEENRGCTEQPKEEAKSNFPGGCDGNNLLLLPIRNRRPTTEMTAWALRPRGELSW